MTIPMKEYRLSLEEFTETKPFYKGTISNFLVWAYDLDDATDLANYQLPSDLTTNATIYNELYSLIVGYFAKEDIAVLYRFMDQAAPTSEEYTEAAREWAYRFVRVLNMTYEYYVPLLTFYRANKTNLMDDITATSKNKVKFNDTPQNPNTAGVYEGDDYITHFTATENESKSPLNSKIMRLKEIQDNYKNVLYDWVKQFEKIFYEGED